MAYVFYNPNPAGKFTSDCVVSGLMTVVLMKTETIVEEDRCTVSKIAPSMLLRE